VAARPMAAPLAAASARRIEAQAVGLVYVAVQRPVDCFVMTDGARAQAKPGEARLCAGGPVHQTLQSLRGTVCRGDIIDLG